MKKNNLMMRAALGVSLVLFFFCSCKKGEVDVQADGLSVYVKDLVGDTAASVSAQPGKVARPFYLLLYNFSDGQAHLIRNKVDSALYLEPGDWDLAFTGPYNCEVYQNNSRDAFNPGFGGLIDKTAIVRVDMPYDQVSLAPADAEFDRSEIGKVGWSATPESNGWFFYSLSNHICVPIKNRTYLLRTRTGKYAKLELQNIYKGNPPVVTDLFWPAPFISFRYYIQADGSRNLKTK